jgi:predicted phage gp36 major capsid-like protein
LVDSVLEIEPSPQGSRIIQLVQDYESYLARKLKEMRESVQVRTEKKKVEAPIELAPKRTGISNNQRRSWERERDDLEAEITRLEKRQAELHSVLADTSTYDDQSKVLSLIQEQTQVDRSLGEKMGRWEELCSFLV